MAFAVSSQMPAMFGEYVEMIAAGTYESTSLRLASGAENVQAITEFGRASDVDTRLFEPSLEPFRDAARRGHGVNLAAIFEILKQSPG